MYVNLKKMEFSETPIDGSIKFPTPVMLIAGPVLGLVYIIFLPLIGFATLFGLATHKLVKHAKNHSEMFYADHV